MTSPDPESGVPSVRSWSFARKIIVYLILAAMAVGSIYLIDRKVPAIPTVQPTTKSIEAV